MDAVVRAAAVYLFLVVVFRIAGELTLASMTTFDFVLLLIIAEATQQALIGDDFSLTKMMLVIVTLISGIDIGFHFSRSAWIKSSTLCSSARRNLDHSENAGRSLMVGCRYCNAAYRSETLGRPLYIFRWVRLFC